MSKYRVISGPYFPVFSPNTGKYEQEIPPCLDTFHTVKTIREERQGKRLINPIPRYPTLHFLLYLLKYWLCDAEIFSIIIKFNVNKSLEFLRTFLLKTVI